MRPDLMQIMGLGEAPAAPMVNDRGMAMAALAQRFATNADAEFDITDANPFGPGGHGDNPGVPPRDEGLEMPRTMQGAEDMSLGPRALAQNSQGLDQEMAARALFDRMRQRSAGSAAMQDSAMQQNQKLTGGGY
jgi:hypothetical protein